MTEIIRAGRRTTSPSPDLVATARRIPAVRGVRQSHRRRVRYDLPRDDRARVTRRGAGRHPVPDGPVVRSCRSRTPRRASATAGSPSVRSSRAWSAARRRRASWCGTHCVVADGWGSLLDEELPPGGRSLELVESIRSPGIRGVARSADSAADLVRIPARRSRLAAQDRRGALPRCGHLCRTDA